MKTKFVFPALALGCALLSTSFPLFAQTLAFDTNNFSVGSGPGAIVAADLSGDGKADLVCANFGFRFGYLGQGGGNGTTLSVLKNNGSGGFSAQTPITVGLEPSAVAVADVNGDGKLDLISANFGANNVSVLTNNGSGGFSLRGTFTVGSSPVNVVAADVNGDGKKDLIAVNFGGNNLTILTNSGNGNFVNYTTVQVGAGPAGLVAVDVNGDGKVDLVCANYGSFGSGNTLTVLTNNGQGIFTLKATITVGGGPGNVIAADVNGDGKVDLITANGSVSTLTVLTNDGTGNFGLKGTISINNPGALFAADMNGDGKIDLVCPNSGNGFAGSVTVLTNNGQGVFGTNAVIALPPGQQSNYADGAAVADFNGDGLMDMATANFGTASITVLTQKKTTPNTKLPDQFGSAFLVSPQAIAISPKTFNIYVADGSGKLVRFDQYGNHLGTYGTSAGPGQLSGPNGCAVDASGNVYVGDYGSHQCVEFTGAGVYVATFGGSSNGTNLGRVTGVAVDGSRNVYVVDDDNSRVVVFAPSGTVTSQFSTIISNRGLAGTVGLAFDATGDLWVADYYYQQFARYTVAGVLVTHFGTFSQFPAAGQFLQPYGLTVDAHNNIYVTDTALSTVQEFSRNGEFEGFVGTAGTGTASFISPEGVAVDRFKRVLVSDAGNHRILVFPPPPSSTQSDITVNVTAPTNGTLLTAPATVPVAVTATDTNGIKQVDLYVNGNFIGTDATPPYSNALNNLAAGSYAIKAVATDDIGFVKTSAVVHITVNNLNTRLIDFDALNATSGAVNGAALSNYLGAFGVKAQNVTPANTTLDVVNDNLFLGGNAVNAASGNNFLTTKGTNGAGSYTLVFAQPYASVSWTRARVLAGTAGAAIPGWRAHAFDASGTELGSVGQNALTSYADIAKATFRLVGSNGTATIASIRFVVVNNSGGALDALPIDDLLLSTISVNSTFNVNLTNAAGALTAPAQVVLNASVFDNGGTVTNVDFFEGANFAGSAKPVSGVASLTVNHLAAGNYTFTAVAADNVGLARSSGALAVTVQAAAGVTVINFDRVDTTKGTVGGAALSNYLASFGIKWTNVTEGTALEAVNAADLIGSAGAVVSSPPNLFTQAGLNQPVSFALRFNAPVQSFGFTRTALVAGSAGATHPAWKATLFDANGRELGTAAEGLISSATNVPARSFVLTGTGITRVRFESDSRKKAAFSAVLLDDLILNTNGVPPVLAITILNPANNSSNFFAPANITINTGLTNTLGANFQVAFFAGQTLIGTVSNAPYNFSWTNVAAGDYLLRAQLVDVSGITAFSPPVHIIVRVGVNATPVNFDALNATTGPVTGVALSNYLAGFGMDVVAISPGTKLVVENQNGVNGGATVLASSPSNILTQTGSNGPVDFVLRFAPRLSQFSFTRPELTANPFVSHPAWRVSAFDAAGVQVARVSETEIGSPTNVPARAFTLAGPGIATIQFSSFGSGLAGMTALLLDDFVLTTNAAPFPPAVVITNPAPDLTLVAPSVLALGASAVDPTGITGVDFYANGVFVATASNSPFTTLWTNPPLGVDSLTAMARNNFGLTRTSPVVNITIVPGSNQFGIVTLPVSQTVATGTPVTFDVAASFGTNALSYQWFHNNTAVGVPSATLPTLSLTPVQIPDSGVYRVRVSAGRSVINVTANLTVLDPPSITSAPASQVIPIGTTLPLTVQASGAGPLTYQWTLNGTPIAGATNSIYSIDFAQPLDSGNYQVVVGEQVGSAQSAAAIITVQVGNGLVQTADNFANRISINPLLGPVAGNNQAATAETGEPLHANKPGGKSIWYTWHASFTGVISLTTAGSDFDTLLAIYSGTNLAKLTRVASDDDAGDFFTSLVTFNATVGTDYQIAVDGFKGASGNVVLGLPSGTGYRVLSPVSGNAVPVITKNPASQLIQPGAKATLSVTATSATKLTYQWNFNGGPILNATNNTFVINNFQAGAVGLYDVLVANAVGPAQSLPASLQIAAGATESSEDKFGNAVNLATVHKSVEFRDPAALGGTSGFSVSQTFSTIGATREAGEPAHCGQIGGASQWYLYTAQGSGTLHVTTMGSQFNTIVSVYTGPGTSFATLVERACGFTTNFETDGQPDLIIPGVAAGTVFYIAVDGYQGAAGVARLQIGLGQAPAITVPPTNQLVTPGSNATLRVQLSGSPTFGYQWQRNGVNINRATNSSFTVTNAQAGSDGTYTVIVSNVVAVVTSAPPATLTLQLAPHVVADPTNQTVLVGKKAAVAVGAIGVNVKTNALHYQWYFNGASLGGATNPTVAFAAAHWGDNGSYYVTISNSYGAVTSAVAVLTVLDTNLPTVVFTGPAPNVIASSNQITVTGTAADNVGVALVTVQVNNNAPLTASGTNTWTVGVPLAPGTNVLTAQSQDLAGNVSHPVKRNVIYKVASMLTIVTNGVGKVIVAGGVTNHATLFVNQSYTLRAAGLPGSNWLFANWTSAANGGAAALLSTSSNLTFTMLTNLVLTANFVTNPFPAVSGVYHGLFYPGSGVTEAGSGFITATFPSNTAGAFSGKLLLDGGNNAFAGLINPASGDAQAVVARSGKTPVTVWLHLNLATTDDLLTGAVSNAAWYSPIVADRAVFNATTRPAANYQGEFTLTIPPVANGPDGYGYVSLSNSLAGAANIVGVLADGTPFSQSTAVAKDGSIPFYASLYSGKGSALGWIMITNKPPQLLTGEISWIKPAIAKTLYPLGFTNLLDNVQGSPFAHTPGLPPLNIANGTLTLSNGNLVAPLVYKVGITNGTTLTNLGTLLTTNKLAITINTNSGVVTATFRPTGATADKTAHGVILQNQNAIEGSFQGTNQSGTIFVK